MVFCDWLLLFPIMFSKFIHILACISIPVLFYGCILFHYMVIIPLLFTGSSVGGNLGCFQFLAIINNVAINIQVKVFARLFSKAGAPFYNPISIVGGF